MHARPADLTQTGRRWVRGRALNGLALHGLAPLTIGLAVSATVMAGACTWQARDASARSRMTARETALAQAYQDINSAANREYSAQLRYLSAEPGSHTAAGGRAQVAAFALAQADLHAAVERVKSLGTVEDKTLATYVLMEDRQYGQNARTVFAAVEDGQIARAQHLATTITGPRVDVLISRCAAAAAAHDRRSKDSMAQLTRSSEWAAIAIPASFGVALLLLGGCWVILLKLNRAVRYQASALLAEKQLLSTVIESSPYFVYWKDPDGNYLGANSAFERLTSARTPRRERHPEADRTDPPEPGGDPISEREADQRALIRRLMEIEGQVQAAGAAALDQQATLRSPDGEERRLLFSVLPRSGQHGPEGVIGVGVDVTRLTDLERQLATASRLESVGRLAAGLAHEINNPVQVLNSNTQFLSQTAPEVLDGLRQLEWACADQEFSPALVRTLIERLDLEFLQSEIPKALAESRDGLQRVAGLVRAMKDFAQGGQGAGPCRLNDAVQSVAEISRHEWAGVADLRLDLDPTLGPVICHEGEVKESLLSMVINAAQAVAEKREKLPDSPRGVIEVTTTALPGAARITVRDTGIGMDDAVRQRVFDPFFTTKDVGRGSGQGLHFAYGAIVVHHGGSIDVTSAPGEGSTFTITLPTHSDRLDAPSPE